MKIIKEKLKCPVSRRSISLQLFAVLLLSCKKSNSTEFYGNANMDDKNCINLSETEWKSRLTPLEYSVLRKEGTERPGTSELNWEKRIGQYNCAGCNQPLFRSEHKYESGTGWPSFYDVIHDNIGTKTDKKLFMTRTEYHCSCCKGHQGHVFKDGPAPTGLRYCNNGVALKFVPSQQT